MSRFFAGIILITLFPVSFIRATESLNNEIFKCAALKSDLKRLSCYDQLSGIAPSFEIETVNKKSTIRQNTASTTEKTQESTFGLTGKNSIPVPSTSDNFGLNKAPSNLDELISTIPGYFTGWKKGDKITLANGQVWKIVDGKNSVHHNATNPEVTITKGMFDSYRISIKGLNKSTRVVRIK